MTKAQAKDRATKILQSAIGSAYYKLENDDTLSNYEKELICEYINKLGERACKAINIKYVAY